MERYVKTRGDRFRTIGASVGTRASAIGMKILGYDPLIPQTKSAVAAANPFPWTNCMPE